MKKRRIRILDILMVIILIGGIGIFSYPFVEDSLNDFLAQQLITHYQKEANEKNEKEVNRRQEEMEKENKKLAESNRLPGLTAFNNAVDAAALKDLPSNDFYMEHMLGVIEIPKINVSLPIFDQTTDAFLQKGTSLLEGSSYPTGGKSTHAVLSGHRGLPEAKLFTDLPELKKGDQFFIQINGKTLAYEVEKIQVILPTDVEPLKIQKGRDLVTLLTCTPYMVNTHRLLVTGHRVPYQKEMKKAIHTIDQWKKWKFIAWIAGLLLIAAAVIGWLKSYIRRLGIGKRNYPVSFYVLDNENQPITGMEFLLKTKNGKHSITRQKEPIKMVSDEEGRVSFPDLKGGKYRLKGSNVDLKIQVKKVKADQFQLKLKTKNGFELNFTNNTYRLKKKYA